MGWKRERCGNRVGEEGGIGQTGKVVTGGGKGVARRVRVMQGYARDEKGRGWRGRREDIRSCTLMLRERYR